MKGYVEYHEPIHVGEECTGNQVVRVSCEDAIKTQHAIAKSLGKEFVFESDQQALNDFITTHWATVHEGPISNERPSDLIVQERLTMPDLWWIVKIKCTKWNGDNLLEGKARFRVRAPSYQNAIDVVHGWVRSRNWELKDGWTSIGPFTHGDIKAYRDVQPGELDETGIQIEE